MSLKFNNAEVTSAKFNNVDINSMYLNNVEVFNKGIDIGVPYRIADSTVTHFRQVELPDKSNVYISPQNAEYGVSKISSDLINWRNYHIDFNAGSTGEDCDVYYLDGRMASSFPYSSNNSIYLQDVNRYAGKLEQFVERGAGSSNQPHQSGGSFKADDNHFVAWGFYYDNNVPCIEYNYVGAINKLDIFGSVIKLDYTMVQDGIDGNPYIRDINCCDGHLYIIYQASPNYYLVDIPAEVFKKVTAYYTANEDAIGLNITDLYTKISGLRDLVKVHSVDDCDYVQPIGDYIMLIHNMGWQCFYLYDKEGIMCNYVPIEDSSFMPTRYKDMFISGKYLFYTNYSDTCIFRFDTTDSGQPVKIEQAGVEFEVISSNGTGDRAMIVDKTNKVGYVINKEGNLPGGFNIDSFKLPTIYHGDNEAAIGKGFILSETDWAKVKSSNKDNQFTVRISPYTFAGSLVETSLNMFMGIAYPEELNTDTEWKEKKRCCFAQDKVPNYGTYIDDFVYDIKSDITYQIKYTTKGKLVEVSLVFSTSVKGVSGWKPSTDRKIWRKTFEATSTIDEFINITFTDNSSASSRFRKEFSLVNTDSYNNIIQNTQMNWELIQGYYSVEDDVIVFTNLTNDDSLEDYYYIDQVSKDNYYRGRGNNLSRSVSSYFIHFPAPEVDTTVEIGFIPGLNTYSTTGSGLNEDWCGDDSYYVSAIHSSIPYISASGYNAGNISDYATTGNYNLQRYSFYLPYKDTFTEFLIFIRGKLDKAVGVNCPSNLIFVYLKIYDKEGKTLNYVVPYTEITSEGVEFTGVIDLVNGNTYSLVSRSNKVDTNKIGNVTRRKEW